jgi:hypothetical protein
MGNPFRTTIFNRSISFLLIIPLWVGIIQYESTLVGDKIITTPLWVAITLDDDYNYNCNYNNKFYSFSHYN